MAHGATLHPRKYLKDTGFIFDARPAQLDKRFLKMLSSEDQEVVKNIWLAAAMGVDISTKLYAVPKTLKQACTLFSHDAQRYLVSMSWIAGLVDEMRPTSIVEMGCGAGLLLDFLSKRFPDIVLSPIDLRENLVAVGQDLTGLELIAGDYLTQEPNETYQPAFPRWTIELTRVDSI